jgi:hypothetical protein
MNTKTSQKNSYSLNVRTFFKSSLFSAVVLAIASAIPAQAAPAFNAESGFGIGFILGTPTGFSGSLPIGPSNAINAALGYKVTGSANLHVQGDYVWIHKNILPVESGTISAYYGPGAFAVAAKDAFLGIRVVGGVDYRFAGPPIQVFLEIGPGINIIPDTEANVGGGLGLRYYF